jgi:biopolymer transport protein TolR
MAILCGNARGMDANPNVTPLIDVLLALLIVFMVVVPVTPRGLTAMLPQPPKSTQPGPTDAIVVEVLAGPHGAMYRINGQSVDGKAGLVAELGRIYAVRAEKVLFVKGDPALSFASVAEVIDAGRAAGADRVAILTPGVTAE